MKNFVHCMMILAVALSLFSIDAFARQPRHTNRQIACGNGPRVLDRSRADELIAMIEDYFKDNRSLYDGLGDRISSFNDFKARELALDQGLPPKTEPGTVFDPPIVLDSERGLVPLRLNPDGTILATAQIFSSRESLDANVSDMRCTVRIQSQASFCESDISLIGQAVECTPIEDNSALMF